MRCSRSARVRTTTGVSITGRRSDVLDYLYNIFLLLKVDDESFQFLQFDVPCYPVVMVSRADVLVGSETFHKLVRVVESVLYNWPSRIDHLTST